jgi:hypothetical protein
VRVTTVPGVPDATVALATRELARITVENADGIVAAGGFIWVKTDDGRIVKVDPVSNTVVRMRRLDTAKSRDNYCQGIGTDGTTVWACAATDAGTNVVKIDANTLAPVRSLTVNKVFDQLRLPYAGGKLWVLGDDGSSAIAVDPTTGSFTSHPLPVRCLQLSGAGSVLVATCRVADLLLRIDTGTGDIAGRRSLPEPGSCTVAGDDVWVDTASGLTRLDRSLRTTAVFPDLGVGLAGDLATDGEAAIWVRQAQGFLFRVDPAHNHVVERVAPRTRLSGGSLLVTPDAIWTTASDDGTLLRLRR